MARAHQDFDLRNVFETERRLLSFSGFYPRRYNRNSFLYYFSAFVNTLVSYLQLFSMVAQMVVDRRDLSKLTDTLLFFMTQLTFLGKLANFAYYKKYLLTLEDDLRSDIFYNFSEKQRKLLTAKFKNCNLIAKTFRWTAFFCIVFYGVVPLIGHGENLPLPGWLPYDTGKYYYETAAFQTFSVCVSAYNNTTIDILTWKLITIASGELEILKIYLKDLDYNCDDGSNVASTETAFRHCVEHHDAVIDLVNKIEFIFSKGIFMQFVSSVVIICSTGFQLMVVPIPSVGFIFLALYFFCMMCQVAMYCWYGHELRTTSDELGSSCYMSNWYDSDIKIRKNIIIFLERTKIPMTLTAGKFVTLTLTTLTRILRSSYSYFAVLQRMYQEGI